MKRVKPRGKRSLVGKVRRLLGKAKVVEKPSGSPEQKAGFPGFFAPTGSRRDLRVVQSGMRSGWFLSSHSLGRKEIAAAALEAERKRARGHMERRKLRLV